jgi:hypothetical protein
VVLQALDAAAVRQWAADCVDALAEHRAEIDGLNVFPVADSDTGTNLLITMRAALDALLREAPTAPGAAARSLARGALIGARGNSGIILSQLLRGLAEGCGDGPAAGADAVRAGLQRAAELATAAVSEPVDGTALTVLRQAALAAGQCPSGQLHVVLAAAARAAAVAVADSPRQLAVLARAGVVDSGGRGVQVLLEALASVAAGAGLAADLLGDPPARAARLPAPRLPRAADALRAQREAGSDEHPYEVMYLLDRTDGRRVERLRAELAVVGDCVSIVGDGEGPDQADPAGDRYGTAIWQVHVHCTDVGAAVEAGVEAGRPHRITVIRFADQRSTRRTGHEPRFTRDRAVVAVVEGDGAAALFRNEGVTVVPAPPTTTRLASSGAAPDPDPAPDPLAVQAAVAGTRAEHVVVLPNGPAAAAAVTAAAAAARETGQDVVVVPTTSSLQGLAAVAVHDAHRRAADDVVAMAEAAGATRHGELVIADSEGLTWVGRCVPGDVLGLSDGEVVLIEHSLTAAACLLLERLLGLRGELVTVLLGEGADDALGEAVVEHLKHTHPEVEVMVYRGGQRSPLLLGVE